MTSRDIGGPLVSRDCGTPSTPCCRYGHNVRQYLERQGNVKYPTFYEMR